MGRGTKYACQGMETSVIECDICKRRFSGDYRKTQLLFKLHNQTDHNRCIKLSNEAIIHNFSGSDRQQIENKMAEKSIELWKP